MTRIDDTTRRALIDARHAELCTRPDLEHHELGCERAECVASCKSGYCRCAGCQPHMDGWLDTLEQLDVDHVDAVLEVHGLRGAFWAAVGVEIE